MNNTLKSLTIAQLETVKESLSSIDEMYELLTEGMKIPANKLTELMKAKTALENAAIHLINFVKVVAVIAVENEVAGVDNFTGKIDYADWMTAKQEKEIILRLIEVSEARGLPGGNLRREPLPGTAEMYERIKELLLVGPGSLIGFDYDHATHVKTGIVVFSTDTNRSTRIVGIRISDLYYILCGTITEQLINEINK